MYQVHLLEVKVKELEDKITRLEEAVLKLILTCETLVGDYDKEI